MITTEYEVDLSTNVVASNDNTNMKTIRQVCTGLTDSHTSDPTRAAKTMNMTYEKFTSPPKEVMSDAVASDESCLQTAQRIINGPRRDDYGPVESSFTNYAIMWSVILNMPVTPHQVALCMDALKTCRLCHSYKLDSLVDKAGYTALAERVAHLPAPLAHLFNTNTSTSNSTLTKAAP